MCPALHAAPPPPRPHPAPAPPRPHLLPAADLIVPYAELLAANGRLGTALEYLDMLPGVCVCGGGGGAHLPAADCSRCVAAQAALHLLLGGTCAAKPSLVPLSPRAAPQPLPLPVLCCGAAGEPTPGVAVLKERCFRCAAGSAQLPPSAVQPPFPFAAGAGGRVGVHDVLT